MKSVHIYTDGSHLDKQHKGRLGCGGVLVIDNKLVDTFGIELPPEYMNKNFGCSTCSNPSAELIAVYFALLAFEKHLKGVDEITIHADYIGVGNWMTGSWKIKEPYIKSIKLLVDSEIKRQNLTGKIKYNWVKGHQAGPLPGTDAYWNNFVDKLAKGKK